MPSPHEITRRIQKAVENDYNHYDPSQRVWVRSQFHNKVYTKAVISDWSVFESVASANPHWVLSGSATAYGGTANSDGGGIISASNSGALCFMKPRTGGPVDKIKWNSSKSPRFRALLKTGTITDARIVMGLYSTARPKVLRDSAGDSNRVELLLDQGADSTWKAYTAGGGASQAGVDTDIAVESDTVYDVDIRVDANRIVRIYINGDLRFTSTSALAASKSLIPVIGIQSEGAKRNMTVFHTLLSQNFS